MPFPPSERVIFERNPLAEVVCELRFPPILRIAAQIPAPFQERIRGTYPVFAQMPFNTFGGFPAQAGGVPPNTLMFGTMPNVGAWQGAPTFVFTTADEKRRITLTQESVSLAERDYTRWETFRDELESLQRELEDEYQPAF